MLHMGMGIIYDGFNQFFQRTFKYKFTNHSIVRGLHLFGLLYIKSFLADCERRPKGVSGELTTEAPFIVSNQAYFLF